MSINDSHTHFHLVSNWFNNWGPSWRRTAPAFLLNPNTSQTHYNHYSKKWVHHPKFHSSPPQILAPISHNTKFITFKTHDTPNGYYWCHVQPSLPSCMPFHDNNNNSVQQLLAEHHLCHHCNSHHVCDHSSSQNRSMTQAI